MTLTLKDILDGAAISEALTDAAHAKHLTDKSVLLYASRAVREALEVIDLNMDDVLPALLDVAVCRVIEMCWEAREVRQQRDIFEDLSVLGRTFERAQCLGDNYHGTPPATL